MNNSKKIIMFAIIVMAIVIITVAGTYAYFLATLGEIRNEVVKVQAGTMALIFSDNSDEINNIERTLNFGDTVEKEFKIENTGTLDAYAKISWDDLTNTFLEGSLTYTLEYKTSEIGTYRPIKIKKNNVPISSSESKQLIVDHLEIPAGATYIYKITITYNDLDIDQTQDLNAVFATKFTLDEGSMLINSDTVIKKLGIKVNPNQSDSVPNFAVAATTDETADGLFYLEDDYGTSYYYRGAVENNYVRFGKNKSGQDMYWRIIRFNGDGSARLIYDGTQAFANGTSNDNRVLNLVPRDDTQNLKAMGYMYGENLTSKETTESNDVNSATKTLVDNWYVENIEKSGYDRFLSDTLFCNDRTSYTDSNTTTLGGGYGTVSTYYSAYKRNINSKEPSFKCPEKNDTFTVNDIDIGNGNLTYPVGLITADEAAAAGAVSGATNKNYYLYKGGSMAYWTMSPSQNSNGFANSLIIDVTGVFSAANKGNPVVIVPVINLAAEYAMQFKGQGTQSVPYYLGTE